MSFLAHIAHALMARPSVPVARRPAVTPRWPAAATQSAKQAAGSKVEAAWRALLAAQAQAVGARKDLTAASIDRLANEGRSGERAHSLRLAKADAENRAEAAMRTLQARQTEFTAAVREFYAA
jgi:hypothetical protein